VPGPVERTRNPAAAVVFLHIPKTAGTAVQTALIPLFPAEQICPEHFQVTIDPLSPEQLSRYRLFSGHFYWDQLDRLPLPQTVFTFLREPRARLLSLYYYFRSHRWSAIEADAPAQLNRRKAKELPIREYLRRDDVSIRLQVDNVITRRLLGRKYADSSARLLVNDDQAVELAVEHLKQADAFGLAERSGESVDLIRAATGLNLPRLERLNDLASLEKTDQFEAVERQSIDDETDAEIRRSVRLDNRVYEWACGEFDKRLRALAPDAL